MAEKNKRIREAALRESREIAKLASICLKMPEFVRYKRRALKTKEDVIRSLTEYHDPDPVRYGFGVAEIITSLRVSEALLKDVEKDAKKGK